MLNFFAPASVAARAARVKAIAASDAYDRAVAWAAADPTDPAAATAVAHADHDYARASHKAGEAWDAAWEVSRAT